LSRRTTKLNKNAEIRVTRIAIEFIGNLHGYSNTFNGARERAWMSRKKGLRTPLEWKDSKFVFTDAGGFLHRRSIQYLLAICFEKRFHGLGDKSSVCLSILHLCMEESIGAHFSGFKPSALEV
jgi:hypothetical protein